MPVSDVKRVSGVTLQHLPQSITHATQIHLCEYNKFCVQLSHDSIWPLFLRKLTKVSGISNSTATAGGLKATGEHHSLVCHHSRLSASSSSPLLVSWLAKGVTQTPMVKRVVLTLYIKSPIYSANYQMSPLELHLWGPRKWLQGIPMSPADTQRAGAGPGLYYLEVMMTLEFQVINVNWDLVFDTPWNDVFSIFCCINTQINGCRSLWGKTKGVGRSSILYTLSMGLPATFLQEFWTLLQ